MDYRLAFSLAALDLKPSTVPAISIPTKADSEDQNTNKQDDQNLLSLQNPDKSPRHGISYNNRDSRTPHNDGRGGYPPSSYDSRSPYNIDGRPPYDNRTPHNHDGRFYDNRSPRISQTPTTGYPYDNYQRPPPYQSTPHQTPR